MQSLDEKSTLGKNAPTTKQRSDLRPPPREELPLRRDSLRSAPRGERMQIDSFLPGLPSRSLPPNGWRDYSDPPSPGLRRDSLCTASGGKDRLEPRGFEPLTPTMPLWCSTN